MKVRTIEELHDPKIGHRKFAKIVDLLIAKGHKVTEIKEYNEQFKFKVDGDLLVYRKEWKSSAKDFAIYIENLLDTKKRLLAKDKSIYKG